jgi:hypothetical protein
MSEQPDRWLVIKITPHDDSPVVYKIFATWYGSYLGSSSWRMNSGIVSVTAENEAYIFTGYSGSQYHCHKNNYGNTGYGAGVLANLIEKAKTVCDVEVMDESTNWMEISYE